MWVEDVRVEVETDTLEVVVPPEAAVEVEPPDDAEVDDDEAAVDEEDDVWVFPDFDVVFVVVVVEVVGAEQTPEPVVVFQMFSSKGHVSSRRLLNMGTLYMSRSMRRMLWWSMGCFATVPAVTISPVKIVSTELPQTTQLLASSS